MIMWKECSKIVTFTFTAICTFAIQTNYLMAFSEDVCVMTSEDGKLSIENCLNSDYCGPNAENHLRCRANSLLTAMDAFNYPARSVLHTDSTFFIAQMIGLREDVAYWIAAYNESADVGTYVPFDMFGKRYYDEDPNKRSNLMPEYTTTANMFGWYRQSGMTGGINFHFPAVFKYSAQSPYPGATNPTYRIDGQQPRLDDPIYEGQLYHLRQWALFNKNACTNGLSEYDSVSKSFFTSSTCYRENVSGLENNPASAKKWISGRLPLLSMKDDVYADFAAYSGPAIAKALPVDTNSDGVNDLLNDVIYDYDLYEELLSPSLGILYSEPIEQKPKVPAIIARMGIYLHFLQDRISHYQCSDASIVNEPDKDGYFHYTYSTEQCTADLHAVRHYEELGFPAALIPQRTYSAMIYTWDELVSFAQMHPQFLEVQFSPAQLKLMKEEVIGNKSRPGILFTDAISKQSACERVQAIVRLNDAYGLQQMPGYDIQQIETMCPQEEIHLTKR